MHVAIGTPMYGGACMGTYHSSVLRLTRALAKSGVRLSDLSIGNEALVNRARNMLAWHVLQRADITHMLFWDGDIGADPEAIFSMLNAGKGVLGAICPLKGYDWAAIAAAARRGVPAHLLARAGVRFNFERDPEYQLRPDAPFRVKRIGAGILLIRRDVLEALRGLVPWYYDDNKGEAVPRDARIPEFFPTHVRSNRLLPEDYGFCDLVRTHLAHLDCEIWADPRPRITHTGTHTFEGCYADTLSVASESAITINGNAEPLQRGISP